MPRRSIEESKIRISSTTVVETRKKKRSRRTKDPEEPSQMTRLKPRAPQEQEGSDEPTSENGYVESMKKTYYVISSAQCFFYLDEVIMAIVSILDHITDLTLLISWMDPDSDVPLAVVILSSLSVGITMIVPVFMYKECYIKIAMLCFCGMLALIYRVNSDPDSLQKLTWATEKRGSISMALFELKKGEKLIQKIIAEHDERKAQIAPHKMTPAIREKFKKKLDLAKIVEVKNAFKRLRRIEDRETMKELMEDLEIPKRVEYSDEIDLKEFISKLMKIQRRNTSDLLEYHAPRLYKMFEAICESLPQLLLQIYVLMMRDGSLIEKASQDYLLVFSLVSSFVSHAYSGMKLLYPENSKQAMIAFLATLIDTLFRSIGFLYLFVAMEFSLRRLIFLLSYISLSIILFNFIVVYVESRDSIFYSMILPFLYAFVFCFSAVTGLFLMVNAFDTDTDRMQCILVSELLFRIVSLCLLLYGALDANVQLMCAFVATTGFLTFIFYSIIFFFSLVENIPRSNYGNIFVDRLGWSLLPFLFILIVPIMPFVFFSGNI